MDSPDDLGLISIPGHLLCPDWLVDLQCIETRVPNRKSSCLLISFAGLVNLYETVSDRGLCLRGHPTQAPLCCSHCYQAEIVTELLQSSSSQCFGQCFRSLLFVG